MPARVNEASCQHLKTRTLTALSCNHPLLALQMIEIQETKQTTTPNNGTNRNKNDTTHPTMMNLPG